MIKKLISGGQTGIDKMGLKVARSLGIPTGGTAAKDFRTEDGPDLELRDLYGLKECQDEGYPARTELNVVESSATVLFGDMMSTGSGLTIRLCIKHGREHYCNPDVDSLVDWLIFNQVETLNVAGNRGSKLRPWQITTYAGILTQALVTVNNIPIQKFKQ